MAEKRKERQPKAEPKTANPRVKEQKKQVLPSKKRATFRLEAPDAREVFLAGTFNEWNPAARPLKRDKNGIWATMMMLGPGDYEYRFVVDGEWWDDPRATERTANEHGTQNCIIRITE